MAIRNIIRSRNEGGRGRTAMVVHAVNYPPPPPASLLFTMDDLEKAYQWICLLRKNYSPNSDIWDLRRDWKHIKDGMLACLNDGSYEFGLLNRLEFDDGAVISLWTSQDMVALKLVANALRQQVADHIPKSCYNVKGHGGLKKAVTHTYAALPEYRYVLRSDIKSYYASICFDVLESIIKSCVNHPVLLNLIMKACRRTETCGGNFYDYDVKGLPKGSPLSPILSVVALLPLDQAMGQIKNIFYARFADDWVVLTTSKTALRKIVKVTHQVVNGLKLQLHPRKTYIGKIAHGFNFLAYYMDDHKILPSTETIRRLQERAVALYEEPQTEEGKHRRRRNPARRDISEYEVNEAAPADAYFQQIIMHLRSLVAGKPKTLAVMQQYVCKWARWLKEGLSTVKEFEAHVQTFLPGVFSCWTPAPGFAVGVCQ